MKKSIFLLGVAVAAMTSCSNDKLLDQAEPIQRAIGFDSFVNKTTKAVTATDASITKFYAFGYYTASNEETDETPIFKNGNAYGNIAVTKPASGVVWDYTNTEYWTKNYYHFAGYANGNNAESLTAEFTEHKLTITDYIVNDANDLVADVLEIDNTLFQSYDQPVTYDFKHLLSKIEFKVINTDNDFKMRIVEPLVISGIKTQGSVEYTESNEQITETTQDDGSTLRTSTGWSATWEPTGGNRIIDNAAVVSDEEAFIPTYAENAAESTISSTDYLVMPQSLATVEYSIKVEFYNDEDDIVAEKNLTGFLETASCDTWVAGNAYVYTISLPTAEKQIEFGNPGFIDWNVNQPIELNNSDPDAGV